MEYLPLTFKHVVKRINYAFDSINKSYHADIPIVIVLLIMNVLYISWANIFC